MTKYRILIMLLLLAVTAALQLTITGAHETATPAPTMDMSNHDANADSTHTHMAGGDITLRFAAHVGEKDFSCGITYDGLGADNSSVQVSDFRFYVSNVRLLDHDNNEVPLELDQDGLWQFQNVALLDFEDGSAACGEGGNDLIRTKVTGTVPEGEYVGVVFDVGVPFELNHLDITTAASPLNLDAMWWIWSVGYKFIRIDMTASGNAYFVHLGSTGCNAASDTEAPTEPCSNPNVMTVRFDHFDVTKNLVIADLATLVNGVTLSESEPRPPGCMSGPDDSDCVTLFPNLGLGLATGLPSADIPQQMFHME